MRRWVFLSIPWAATLAACSTGRGIRPIGQGRAAVGLSVGGPLVGNLGGALPLPITAAYVRLGADARTDVEAAFYPPISRAMGADVGVSYLALQPSGLRPAVMASGRAMGFAAPHRSFVELASKASWDVGRGPKKADRLLFVGLAGLWQPWRPAQGPRWTPKVSAGAQLPLGARWSLQAELSWMAFAQSSRALVVHYRGLHGRGALGLQLGLAFYFAAPGTSVPTPAAAPARRLGYAGTRGERTDAAAWARRVPPGACTPAAAGQRSAALFQVQP